MTENRLSQEERIKYVIEAYFRGLESKSYEDIVELFSTDAIVNSPLYGKIEASHFYKDLFLDTKNFKIVLKNIFLGAENPDSAAAHFVYTWVMKDGTLNQFECVDIFEFEPRSKKIVSLKIIYDTHQTRQNFEKLRE